MQLKLAEVAHFLLIVRQIGVLVMIMRARKLGRVEPTVGGEGPGIWLDRYANTVTRLGLGLNTAKTQHNKHARADKT